MSDSQPHFAFVDGGRTFTCEVETPRRAGADAWWWFRVSTEQHQRFAPFRAEAADSQADVQTRIVAYYEELLRRRAEPARPRWQRRSDSPATPATPPAT
jgi:hypothetical protein